MQQMEPSAKILTWALCTPKDEQNAAFIEISEKIAVENPEIFAKYLEDFQKKSGKFPGNTQDNAVTSSTTIATDIPYAMRVATFLRNKHLVPAIKEFRTWTGCGLKEAKDCIDRIRDPKAKSEASFTYWGNIKLVLEYM